MKRKIRFGIPKGYLNSRAANKGYTGFLLQRADFVIEGYKPGKEVQMPIAIGEGDIEFHCMKPKQFPVLLQEHGLDIAIIGRDTVEEACSIKWQDRCMGFSGENMYTPAVWEAYRQKIKSRFDRNCRDGDKTPEFYEMADLGHGKVAICWGIPKLLSEELEVDAREDILGIIERTPFINIASAYPNITYGELCRRFKRERIGIVNLVEKERFTAPKRIAKIFPLSSNTESMIRLGLAKFIVDSVASGESFRRNEIKIVGAPITNSTARIYTNDSIGRDYEVFKSGETKQDISCGISLKRLDEIIQRLAEASKIYAKTREDSIWYPGKPAEEAK